LFSQFNVQNVSILAIIETISAYIIFIKTKTKPYFPNIKPELIKIKNSLKLDKLLLLTFIFFCFMLVSFFILASYVPPLEPDSRIYHFVRIFHYIKQQGFSHFSTTQTRSIVMPFNSEMLYSYFYLFKRNILTADAGFGLLSYFSFLNIIFQIYLILKNLKFSTRKTLFTVFTVSSTGAVLVQVSSLQTDLVVASLILSSVYLLIKNKKVFIKTNLFLSSLSYALAIGTKTTAIIFFPAYLILFFYILKPLKNKKQTLYYFWFFVLNFFIFSSYNYILNFIQFHNFICPLSLKVEHTISGGIKEYIYNLVCVFVDFFGYSRGFVYNILETLKNSIFSTFNIGDYQLPYTKISGGYDERVIGFAHLGLLYFISLIISIFYFFRTKNPKYKLIGVFSFVFILNYVLISTTMIYFPYTVRFFVTFVAVSCFCLIYLYKNNVLKYLVVLFSCLNLLLYPLISTRFPIKTFVKTKDVFSNTKKAILFHEKAPIELKNEYSIFEFATNEIKKTEKIAVIEDTIFYEIIQLMNFGYDIELINIKDIENKEKIQKYDYIFSNDLSQFSDNFFIDALPEKSNNFQCYDFIKKYKKSRESVAKYCVMKKDLFSEAGFYTIKSYKYHKRKLYIFKKG
jgi:hypothetical protein